MIGNDQKEVDENPAEGDVETEITDVNGVTESISEDVVGAKDHVVEKNISEDSPRHELESALEKAQENLELAQHTQAEMENLRKRTLRDIENAHKFALERFVNELLPVIDSLELGIQASESVSDTQSLQEGMDLTLKKFISAMEKFGVEVINPQGEKFNPDKHDAVSMSATDEFESGVVISVLQKGYELNSRLIRPAMVVVSE